MTQDRLAELLNVTYQTVSKWECGTTSPDLSLIVPIARLFEVSTDELLGLSNGEARRAEFDETYFHFATKNKEDMYNIAREAVSEFPGEMKYLYWLASMEYTMAFSRSPEKGDLKCFDEKLLEDSIRHFKTVIECTNDNDLKNLSIRGIIYSLRDLDRRDEAKLYAEMLPKRGDSISYLEAMSQCLAGDEKIAFLQAHLGTTVAALNNCLESLLYEYRVNGQESEIVDEILDTQELILSKFTNGDFIGFGEQMCKIYLNRAHQAVADQKHDRVIPLLKKSYDYALRAETTATAAYDMRTSGPYLNRLILKNPAGIYEKLRDLYVCDTFFDEIRNKEELKMIFDENS